MIPANISLGRFGVCAKSPLQNGLYAAEDEQGATMRHVFGGFGVAAALILLCVSAAMNWQFGYNLGKTPFDAHILGAASIAADCMKALMPFFIFAAYRNRNWSQALGGSALWAVCIVYAMTSALGFAALNRSDTAGTRAVQVEKYQDLRTELTRITQQQGELEKHRPVGAIQGDIEGLKQNYRWTTSNGCTNATLDESRELCKTFFKLNSELDTAKKDEAFQKRADELRTLVTGIQQGGNTVKEADPQASIISALSGLDIKRVEVAMTILVMLLVELGSSLGLYVATSTWRVHETMKKPAAEPVKVVEIIRPATTMEVMQPPVVPVRIQPQLAPPAKSDIEAFFDARIRQDDGASVTALTLYDNYCDWCEVMQRQPVGLPIFSRQLTDLGVQKAKIAGKIRYIGIRIGSHEEEEDNSDLAAAVS